MQAYAPLLQLVRQLHDGHREAMTDGELLQQFLAQPEQATFNTLVRRHGTMVFHVCRRVLGSSHDVEDAFQATFLVLVQKATELQHRDTVGDWLHGVAHHTALKARAMISKRSSKERLAARPVEAQPMVDVEPWQHILDEEIRRLPVRYRQALVLCDLEQKTRKEAAQSLGWREGTVASRLARGRSMLCKRLKSRGVEITAALVSVELAQAVQANALPLSLMHSVTQAACELAGGMTVISAVSIHVAALMKAGLASTMTHKTSLLVAGLAVAVGITGWNWPGSVEQTRQVTMVSQPVQSVPAPAEKAGAKRTKGVSPAHSSAMLLAKRDQPAVKQRPSQGSDEEIVLELGLSDEQFMDFLMVRHVMRTQSQEMYKMSQGKRERGLEINREWNDSLTRILTPEQYSRYCEYWDEHTFRASR